MSRGLPAFGWADRGTSHTADSRSTVSSIGAGPTLQFTPTTSAPRAASASSSVSTSARSVSNVAGFEPPDSWSISGLVMMPRGHGTGTYSATSLISAGGSGRFAFDTMMSPVAMRQASAR